MHSVKSLCPQASKCFSMAPHIRSHRAPCSCFLKKMCLKLSSEQSVGDVWIAQLEWKSSTGEVPWLQKFCCRNCWVFVAPCKSERQLTTENAECCRTRGSSLCVLFIAFQSLDLETSFLVHSLIFRISRSSSYTNVTGWRSQLQKKQSLLNIHSQVAHLQLKYFSSYL